MSRGRPRASLHETLRRRLGSESVLTTPSAKAAYRSDGLAHLHGDAAVVVLPRSTEDVRAVLRVCRDAGVPWVARGSGTGLSGGAVPVDGGVLIALSRMRRVVSVNLDDERITVEPGVTNMDVSRAVSPTHFYPPDPSSQVVCSIGGNVAENSGGAHCLKYGFTTHHVLEVEAVMPDGSLVHIGSTLPDPLGPDLLGLVIGSEGTLAVVTKVTVRILRKPEAVQTLLAAFTSIGAGGQAVSDIIGA
ncbi:MAG TPA: FAD-binding protein, partial [Actinomycetota bacterium]